MFDKVKELNQLRKAQSEIKKELENIFATAESGDTKIVVRGDKKIERIEIDGQEDKKLKDAINSAFKDVDKKVQKQLRGKMSDLGFPGL